MLKLAAIPWFFFAAFFLCFTLKIYFRQCSLSDSLVKTFANVCFPAKIPHFPP